MKRTIFLLLMSITFIASFLRLWQLGHVPVSLDWDEAALGYNAYSLMQTGKDEYGEFLPVVLQSFNDYKPGFYTYLIMPLLPILGLSAEAVRLPSALIGIATVIGIYFLTLALFAVTRDTKQKNVQEYIVALAASGFLALSPWHVQFSRAAFEANVGLACNVFGSLFFLKGLQKPVYLILSACFFAVSLYTYQSEKVFAPLLVLLLASVYGKDLLRVSRKYLVFSILIGIIVAGPLLLFTFTNPKALTRFQGLSPFANPTELLKPTVERLQIDANRGDFMGLIFDNRRIVYGKTLIENYLSHFDANWLFITGDSIPRHQPPGMGHLYLFELPFLLIGIYMLFFSKFSRKTKLFILGWILITPIPAAMTWQVPHAIRTLHFLPAVAILEGIGFYTIFFVWREYFRTSVSRFLYYSGVGIFGVLVLLNVFYFLNQYFVQYNYFHSQDWQYGYSELIPYVKDHEKEYKKIIVSTVVPLDQSYIFFLFHLQYSPSEYQKVANKYSGEYKAFHAFGKYEFRQIDWGTEKKEGNTLYIIGADEVAPQVEAIKIINFLNGKPAIKLIEG